MGWVNVLWQADANAAAVAALGIASSPPAVLNVAGPELLRVRDLAERFAAKLDRSPRFAGEEGTDALLSDSSRSRALFGDPRVGVDRLIDWIADWVRRELAVRSSPV